MTANVLVENGHLVDSLRYSMARGGVALDDVPDLLKRIVDEGRWRERIEEKTGEIVRFDRFDEFIATPPLEGLGGSIETLRRLCGSDPAALDALDRATQGQHGGDRKSALVKFDNVQLDSGVPTGNTSAAALRRLRKDRPDLHERVLACEMSPHAAMVEAGFRVPTISVPLDSERAARALAKHFAPDDLRQLIARLAAMTEGDA